MGDLRRRIGSRLLEILAAPLEPEEREAALGDLEEGRVSGMLALWDVAGLVLRREAEQWKKWRAWAALAGIVGPIGLLLIFFALHRVRMFELHVWILENHSYFDHAQLEATGLTARRGVAAMLRYAAAAGLWSWTGGFALGALSPKSAGVSLAGFAGVAALVLWIAAGAPHSPRPDLLIGVTALTIVAPFGFGVWRGMRHGALGVFPGALVTAAVICATWLLLVAGEGTLSASQMALSIALCWPSAYMLVSSVRRDRLPRTGGRS